MTEEMSYIFLNNLAISYLICYLTSLALREHSSAVRLLIAALFGGVFAVLISLMEKYIIPVKIITSVIMVLIIKKEITHIKDFSLPFTVLFGITLVFSGVAYTLESAYGKDSYIYPFVVSVAAILAFSFTEYAVEIFIKRKKHQDFEYRISIEECSKKIECRGYYDTGNKLCDEEGNPIVVISRRLYEKMNISTVGEMKVNTVGGEKKLPMINLTFKIYYDKGSNKIYKTKAVVSDSIRTSGGIDLILNREMGGIDE